MLIYRVISILLLPFLEIYLLYRVIKKKEDKLRLRERLGNPTIERPDGELIWIHAVSVGEANSALVLLDDLLQFSPKISILFTTTTLTSASIIATRLPEFKGRVIHQFLPIDSYFCVQNFLSFWQPIAAIFVESEIWPNLIFEAQKLGILSFLVNARMSEKSVKKWRIARRIGFKVFDQFAAIFAQTFEDKKRFEKLTRQEILLYGNLKSQAQNLVVNLQELNKLKEQVGNRKTFVAVSTHKGEEEIILQSFFELKKEFPDLLLVIVPRHPNRADEVKLLFESKKFAQRSRNEIIESSTEIYLADTLGELRIFYSLTNFAFIGGSLLEVGGHNPFEAIKLNCAIISGSHVFNFREIYSDLSANNGCFMLSSVGDLSDVVGKMLREKDLASVTNQKAGLVLNNSENIAKKITAKIDQMLQAARS